MLKTGKKSKQNLNLSEESHENTKLKYVPYIKMVAVTLHKN